MSDSIASTPVNAASTNPATSAPAGPRVADLAEDGQPFAGTVALSGVNIRTSKRGSLYATGSMSDPSGSTQFIAFTLPDGTLEPGVYRVTGTGNVYQGAFSLRLDTFTPRPDEVPEDWMPSRYDEAVVKAASNALVASLSSRARALIAVLLSGDGSASGPARDIRADFMREFAAISHHDNVKHGLLAHSYKTAFLAKTLMDEPLYGWDATGVDQDIVVAGALLHDIGKVDEYAHGSMSDVGRLLSHRTLAVERATLLRDRIVKVVGEDGYHRLLAVFCQHHGEFEETPRCVEAYLVHLADTMESHAADVAEQFGSGGDQHRVDGLLLA